MLQRTVMNEYPNPKHTLMLTNHNTSSDPHFLASEEYTYKFGQQLLQIVKYHRRIARHISDLAATGSDLGAAYNSWSLMETAGPVSIIPKTTILYDDNHNQQQQQPLSHAIESVGEAVDTTVSAMSQLAQTLEVRVSQPLSEYEKLTSAIEVILKWRHARHVDYEGVTESLVAKRAALAKLVN